jgi:hypothetical protein
MTGMFFMKARMDILTGTLLKRVLICSRLTGDERLSCEDQKIRKEAFGVYASGSLALCLLNFIWGGVFDPS